jgi:hypothetical protein
MRRPAEVVMSTTWDQLEGAVLSLARSGALKERLTDAFRNHLVHLDAAELPEEWRADFCACRDSLTRERPLRGEDAVRATVRKMSNEEAEAIAQRLVQLYAGLARAAHETPAPSASEALMTRKPLKSVPQVISLYAAEA